MIDPFFKPVSGFDLPRFAGVPTFMRLPYVALDTPKIKDVDIGIIGVPWDSGTTNRPGPRHGPRQLRDASTMIRAQHPVSGIRPYEKLNCADLGDVSINPADIEDSMARITSFYKKLIEKGIKNTGVIPPEQLGTNQDYFDYIINYLEKKEIRINFSAEKNS